MQRGGRTQRQKTEQPGGQQHRRITGMAVPGRAQADGDELGLDRTEEIMNMESENFRQSIRLAAVYEVVKQLEDTGKIKLQKLMYFLDYLFDNTFKINL